MRARLRDVKYAVGTFGVHGASYRQKGTDPVLVVEPNGTVRIEENEPVYLQKFYRTPRADNVHAYGGIEDLVVHRAGLPVGVRPVGGGLKVAYPETATGRNKPVPILIPIARFDGQSAAISFQEYNGVAPQTQAVSAVEGSIHFFVDWEMSHPASSLHFSTPAYHIGLRATWVPAGPHAFNGASIVLDTRQRGELLQALRNLVAFDEDFIRVALLQSWPDLRGFAQIAQQVYQNLGGAQLFGLPYTTSFRAALDLIAQIVAANGGLQQHYNLQ